MLKNLLFLEKSVDIVFLVSLIGAFVLLVVVFICSRIVVKKEEKSKEEQLQKEQQNQEVKAEEAPVEETTEEVVAEEEVQETTTEKPVESVVEPVVEKLIVNFYVLGGSDIASIQVEKNQKITEPEQIPARENYEFGGWYQEEECVNPWDFEHGIVEKDTTLYAKWIKVEEAPVEEVASVAEEAPVEEAPVAEEKPVEEEIQEAEEAPVEEAPADEEAPVAEETPVEEESTAKPIEKEPAKKPVVVPVEKQAAKGRGYNGKYEVYPSGDGYKYRLKASNGEILVVSEEYSTHDTLLKAIDAVKRNIDTGEIRIIEDKHGMFKFKLTSKNYRLLALGSSYSSEKSAIRASESFKRFALSADIFDIEAPEDKEAGFATPFVKPDKVEDKTGGKYVIEKFNGEFSWDLKASNGQILCQAEGYTSKSGCIASIDSFKRNVEVGSFKIIKDKNENYHYNLYTPSGRVAAIGETYNSKQLAESAVVSVMSYYKNAEIIEAEEVESK